MDSSNAYPQRGPSMSRTKNATRNIFFGLINKSIHIIFPFIIRATIIQTLGAKYLGLGSLFTSILQVLNLAELGFSNAIIYNMYKPVAEKDSTTICALLNLYKKIYRIIGLVIFIGGLILLPFLPNLIKGDVPPDTNLYILYVIYLINTASTYFLFAYKSALINAHQRNDIVSNVQTITTLLQFSVQIIVLLILKNYYAYIIVQCITSILNNIIVAIIAKKKYPNYICKGEVSKEQRKDIKKRVMGLVIQKVCATTRNSLDSIFISAMLGLTAVAMYSNYYTIMTSIIGVMHILTSSITAGVGNSVATESAEKNYRDMSKFNFIYMWLSGWLTVCLACLYQPVMKLWVGEELMLPYSVVILFCIYFYTLKLGDIRSVYVEACGLWYENRFRAIAETILNIVLNLVLGHLFGIHGIIAGTLISLFFVNFIYGSNIIFKHYFKKQKVSEYFLDHAIYATVTIVACELSYLACLFIPAKGIAEIIIKGAICLLIPNIIYLLVYHWTKSYEEAYKFFKKAIKLSLRKEKK